MSVSFPDQRAKTQYEQHKLASRLQALALAAQAAAAKVASETTSYQPNAAPSQRAFTVFESACQAAEKLESKALQAELLEKESTQDAAEYALLTKKQQLLAQIQGKPS